MLGLLHQSGFGLHEPQTVQQATIQPPSALLSLVVTPI
jgi:hypothetical protein